MNLFLIYLGIGSVLALLFNNWLSPALKKNNVEFQIVAELVVGLLIVLFWPLTILKLKKRTAERIAQSVRESEQ